MVKTQTGHKSTWQGTHNVYLQIASEAGIPALILYVMSIVISIRLSYRCMKLCRGMPEEKLVRAQSFCLLLAILAFAVGLFFSNFTFAPQLPMLIGLAAANALAVKKQVAAQANGVPSQMAMQPAFGPKPAVVRF